MGMGTRHLPIPNNSKKKYNPISAHCVCTERKMTMSRIHDEYFQNIVFVINVCVGATKYATITLCVAVYIENC